MPAEKEIPWCIMFLCIGAIVCHITVLVGNLQTSAAVNKMGMSVMGWSNVGTGIGDSLITELDEILSNVTAQLTEAINRTIDTMDMIDGMLSMMGGTAMSSGAVALQQVAMMQQDGQVIKDPFNQIMDFVTQALGNLPSFQEALTKLQEFMINMKPVLEQVGVWIETFADKIQATVEIFGTTMDKATKIFDGLMSKMSPTAGEGADLMQHETFNLFDTNGDGSISKDDLINCAQLYAVPALAGDKAQELIEKYDQNGDGEISPDGEFGLLVEDVSISGIMATVLRAYAKRLSMVAGNVGSARMRDEVASNVVKYFQLVCSKNLTKVGWVSEMLTNATLPMPFTADVMAELALQKDDPDVLTTSDVGEIVVGMMMTVNEDYTTEAFQLMSSADHWSTEGFDEDDQADVVAQVQSWMQSGPAAVAELEKNMITLAKHNPAWFEHPHVHIGGGHHHHHHHHSLVEVDVQEELGGGEELSMSEQQVLEVMNIMPAVAKRIAAERMQEYKVARWRARAQKHHSRFDTDAKRLLLDHLLHGRSCGADGGVADLAQQALSKGVAAVPETLLFAQWLNANASQTADRLQKECMDYTGESSSPLDAFNTQIQGMVKKLSQFINMMKKYADPDGIQHLEDMIDEFADNGMHDIFEIVGAKIVDVLTGNIDSAIGGDAAANASDSGEVATTATTTPAAESLLEISSRRLSSGVSSQHLHASAASLTALTKPDTRVHFKQVHHKHKRKPKSHAEMLQQSRGHMDAWHAHRAAQLRMNGTYIHKQPAGLSDVWEQVGQTLTEMEKILPTAIELMKFARKEVSAVAANLNSIFGMLGNKGKSIFLSIASLYAELWTAYFVFVFGLTFSILIYGFWASGWFGGPQPLPKTLDDYEPPKTFLDRVNCCCQACCRCCVQCHDTQSCFWSCIMLFQVVVLLLFIVSLVFCILAGVQMFMGSSCMQLYIIADLKVCTSSLNQFSTFLASFNVGEGEVPLSMACAHHELLTCDLIHDKLFMAGIMTVAGSFVSVGFSFELIFGIAIIHERARWRRVINEIEQDKLEKAEAES